MIAVERCIMTFIPILSVAQIINLGVMMVSSFILQPSHLFYSQFYFILKVQACSSATGVLGMI